MKYSITFILLVFLVSCGSKKVLTKYYTFNQFNTDSLQTKKLDDPIPHSVYIQKIGVASPYNDNTIALRTASNELQYFVYHKWAEKPATAIRHFIWQSLISQNVFKACDISLYQLTPEYELTGYIDQIERVNADEFYGAHLKMTLELKKSENLESLIIHSFNRTISMDESTSMNQFAAGVSEILEDEVNIFIKQIQNYFIQ